MLNSLAQACNEEAFRYLLGVQRRRSEQADQPFLLLLVDLEAGPGLGSRIDRVVARKLFSGMCRALRETDLVGWYCDERVAGAILGRRADETLTDEGRIVAQRVADVLVADLPLPAAHRVRVRVEFIRPNLAAAS
jgi:hypothetical protein